nr:hypothetical protein [Desulfosarcina cetonica]
MVFVCRNDHRAGGDPVPQNIDIHLLLLGDDVHLVGDDALRAASIWVV